jgi:hypothetical protein
MTKQNKTEETTFTPEEMTQLEELSIPLDLAYTGIPEEEENTQTALVPVAQSMQTIEGLSFPPNLSEEQKEVLYESISSYIGVIPKPVDEYIGQWLVCLGAVVQPITNETTDEETGEVRTQSWVKPLFKIADGKEIILGGGGKYGLEFARNMTNLFGAGDWTTPRMIRVTQEARTGQDGTPRRMYRFGFLSMASYQKQYGAK